MCECHVCRCLLNDDCVPSIGFWASEGSSYLALVAQAIRSRGHIHTGFWASKSSSCLVGRGRKLLGRGGIFTTLLEPRLRCQFELLGRWRKLLGRRGIFTTLQPRPRCQHRFLGVRGFEILGRCASDLVAGAYSQPFWSHDYRVRATWSLAQAIGSRGHIHSPSGATIALPAQVFGRQRVRATWSLAQAIGSRGHIHNPSGATITLPAQVFGIN